MLEVPKVQDPMAGPHASGERLTGESDLAARWLGGSIVAASDESFGEKENLLNPSPAHFEPGHYGNRGEIVDGWETKRRREPGNDWALIRLGTPGVITSIDIDTSFFTGNHPGFCRVEACGLERYPSPTELNDPATEWVEIVPNSPLRGDSHNWFPVAESLRFTHVRLSTFPDGGVARLRVIGRVLPDPRQVDRLTIDLASQEYGGLVVESSDGFYTSAQMLNRPDRARTMGEGWETRRRRDSGNDYVVIRLGFPGEIYQLVIDTNHFKYNASAEVEVHGCDLDVPPSANSKAWTPLMERTRLQPDTRHVFMISSNQKMATVRLDAYPDGGLSRVSVIGHVDPVARQTAGYRWFNALPRTQAIECLVSTKMTLAVAEKVVQLRPFPDDWLDSLASSTDALPSQYWTQSDQRSLRYLLEGIRD